MQENVLLEVIFVGQGYLAEVAEAGGHVAAMETAAAVLAFRSSL